MSLSGRTWIAAAIAVALGALFVATRDLPHPAPIPPGSFAFAALGDAPYYPWEEIQYRHVLDALDRDDLAWVLHVGDIFWRPCTDEHYRKARARLDRLRHPVVYTPGDNEWRDCHEPGSGGFDPEERLISLRRIFFEDPGRSLGGTSLPLEAQGGREPYPELIENARWSREGFVVATVHVVGSQTGTGPGAGGGPSEAASRRRTEGAAAWVRETFAAAAREEASAVILAFHADPVFENDPGDPYRRSFDPFPLALEEEADRFGRPVLLIHGDFHEYTVDHPLVHRGTGRRLENVTRLQVPGSPEVGWVRIVVTPGAADPFAFEKLSVPRWRYW